jgi:CheY-like chemotaxis protein/HPt (histidine-containing phosphotransfer) domain-containing protein
LAILDYQMPGMDGLELARLIKADLALAPTRLIMLSSVSQRGRMGAAQQANFAAVLTKPVRQSHLYNCLLSVVGTSVSAVVRSQVLPLQKGTPATLHARVLVVEDNAVNQKVAVRLLEKLGCRIDVAANGREAVKLLEDLSYDVVFMDCQMPEMDGFEATAVIRQREATTGGHVPIIAMTANAMQGDREYCLAAGMDDYVSKPVTLETLAAAARKWAAPTPSPADAGPDPAASPASGGPALDVTAVAALRDLGGEDTLFVHDLIEAFVQDAVADMATLHAAADTGNATALERAAHTLTSTSASIGALRMSALCGELQALGRTGSVAGAAGRVTQLATEFERVRQAIAEEWPQVA